MFGIFGAEDWIQYVIYECEGEFHDCYKPNVVHFQSGGTLLEVVETLKIFRNKNKNKFYYLCVKVEA